MPVEYNTEDGAQALDQNLLLKVLDGYAWIDGLDASVSGMDVQLTSGQAFVDASVVSASGSVTLSDGGPDPRKDLVYVDASGSLAVAEGAPDSPRPSSATAFQTYRPSPPDGTSISGTPLWEVWVPEGATTLQESWLRDRRIASSVVFESVSVGTLNGADIGEADDGEVLTSQGDGTAAMELPDVGLEPQEYTEKSSRSFDTWYQNTTGGALEISVVPRVESNGGEISTRVQIGYSGASVDVEFVDYIETQESLPAFSRRGALQAIIPDSAYYRIASFGDEIVDYWHEQEL